MLGEISFIDKDYGYKVVDKYGDSMGKIVTVLMIAFHPKKHVCIMLEEMKEIIKFMEQLECQNV